VPPALSCGTGTNGEISLNAKISCLPVSLYADFFSGARTIPQWSADAKALGLDAVDINALFIREKTPDEIAAIREQLVDLDTLTVESDCQAAQAMALYYGVFDECEVPAAFEVLLRILERTEGRMDMGVLGARVMFHLLSDHGRADLAYRMITTPEFPSYGYWIHTMGATL
jgi:hypothetical protein